MKLKVKITGWDSGKKRSIIRSIETPDFTEQTVSFLGRTWIDTVFRQQIDWVDDNYFEVIVPLAEAEWLHPIEGYVGIEPKPKAKKIDKRQQVIDYAEGLLGSWPTDAKELFLVALTRQWPQIKDQSIKNIFKIVFNTMDVSIGTARNYLNPIHKILKVDSKDIDPNKFIL